MRETERSAAVEWLTRTEFTLDSYKNKRGHAVLVAGSESYAGAAVMCGNAAMRSGVGLTTLCVPRSCKSEIASRTLPEVIVRPIDEENGKISVTAFEDLAEVIDSADSIAVGCGLDANDAGVEKLVRQIVENRTKPVVVDAGALWFFNSLHKPAREQGRIGQHDALANARAYASPPLILTPHEGEFMRLLGTDDKSAIKDRVAAVRSYATENNVILVLKGERVLIGHPDGRVVLNPTGNSGLGKAGNGDTLTGVIAGFIAQAVKLEIDIFETVVAAVYVAGLAGDIAEKQYGKRVMTASDVRECLTDAFAQLTARG